MDKISNSSDGKYTDYIYLVKRIFLGKLAFVCFVFPKAVTTAEFSIFFLFI